MSLPATNAAQERTGQETIAHHPYIEEAGDGIVDTLVSYGYDEVLELERKVLAEHLRDPVDTLVGDDVSGRIPTLITHHFLRNALGGGHIDEVPRTLFMASGRVSNEQVIDEWGVNLKDHAARVAGSVQLGRTMVVTDVVGTGRSVRRLETALESAGATIAPYASVEVLYLSGHGSERKGRIATGVEKYAPEPISRRHPSFDSREVVRLRQFLKQYADAIYLSIFGELPPKTGDIMPAARVETQKVSRLRKAFRNLRFNSK